MQKTSDKIILALILAIFVVFAVVLYLTIPGENSTSIPASPAPPLVKFRFGHNMATDSALHWAAARFAEEVKKRSQGKIEISVHPNQELGNDQQMVDMAQEGELDLVLTPTAKLSVLIPAMQYADLPFYFPDRETLYAMLDGEPGQLLLAKLRTIGLVGVTFWGNGFKQFTANRAIQKPEDFVGLKIRVMKSRLIMEQFRTFGAEPVLIDFHTTRQALADKVVDGQENPLVAIVGMGLHHVQSHLTLSQHAYLGYVLAFSQKSLEPLPEALQEIMLSAGQELTRSQREETDKLETRFLETIRAAGVHIHPLTPEEHQAFAVASARLHHQFEETIGADLISKTEEILGQKDKTAKNHLLIGLDADLSQDAALAGLAIKRGLSLAIDEINQNGGILGKKLTLLARDHGGIPARGRDNIRYFSQYQNLIAIVGGAHSSVASAELDLIQQARIPFLIPWAATAALTENNHQPNFVFRVSGNDRLVGPFLLNYALQQKNATPQKIALLLENTSRGQGLHTAIMPLTTQDHMAPPVVAWFNLGEKNYHPIISDILRAGATTVILVANPQEGSQIINALAQQAPGITIVAHWSITGGAAFWKSTTPALAKVKLVFPQTFTFVGNQKPKARQVAQSYLRSLGAKSPEEIFAPVGTAQAYDILHLLALAIQKAQATDPQAIRTALEQLRAYDGLLKSYSPPFSPSRHDALEVSDIFMATYDVNGYVVPLAAPGMVSQ